MTGNELFVTATVIQFEDGTMEAIQIHRGQKASCERTADLLPAVCYNGSKRAVDARVVIMPASDWDALDDTC